MGRRVALMRTRGETRLGETAARGSDELLSGARHQWTERGRDRHRDLHGRHRQSRKRQIQKRQSRERIDQEQVGWFVGQGSSVEDSHQVPRIDIGGVVRPGNPTQLVYAPAAGTFCRLDPPDLTLTTRPGGKEGPSPPRHCLDPARDHATHHISATPPAEVHWRPGSVGDRFDPFRPVEMSHGHLRPILGRRDGVEASRQPRRCPRTSRESGPRNLGVRTLVRTQGTLAPPPDSRQPRLVRGPWMSHFPQAGMVGCAP